MYGKISTPIVPVDISQLARFWFWKIRNNVLTFRIFALRHFHGLYFYQPKLSTNERARIFSVLYNI